MRRVAVLVAMSLALGPLTTYAAAPLTSSGEVESPESQAPFPPANLARGGSHLRNADPRFIEERATQDCEGKAPSTGQVTALLSRLITSSSVVRGVQCPIPPVPDQSTGQETRP